uniref:Genome polyprotein n=1 Tax=Darwin bee virus 3 TaxID=2201278 RepID=A0A2U8JQ66_9VIRU|nr:polyprotein [Darwin bee virus 3]
MAILYSEMLKAPSCARAPRGYVRNMCKEELRRQAIINRLARKQEVERIIEQFPLSDMIYEDGRLWTPEEYQEKHVSIKAVKQSKRKYYKPVFSSSINYSSFNKYSVLDDNVKDEGSNYVPKRYIRSINSVKPIRVKRHNRIIIDKFPRFIVERNAVLARKLRALIRLLEAQRANCNKQEALIKYLKCSFINAVPESDKPGVDGEDSTVLEKDSNVVLTTQRDSSTAITAPSTVKWSQWTSNDIVDSYASITDRWYQINEVKWTKDHKFDTELYRLVLPRELLAFIENNHDDIGNVPNTIPFRVHAYWRGDMEIKIQINSNKFQVGQLQATWYYNSEQNDLFSTKASVYGFSQMEHAIIAASASNEATIRVNYKHIYPFLPTRDVPDWESDHLDMGSLSLRVLAPLRMSNNGPSSCSVVTFIRLINSEFTGTSSGSLYTKAAPQMNNLLPLAESLLTNVVGGHNMDKPPETQAPSYLVPTGVHSLAHGTNVTEPLHALRLDARGQTKHIPGCEPDEDMTVDSLVRHYGLIDRVQWSKDYVVGAKIWAIDADPFAVNMASDKGLTTYWVPPVGVVAGNYMYWRGSLEYRFDIIASQFHTGRLIVGYIPGYDGEGINIDYNIIKSSPYVVYDLQEGNSFTFEVPYTSYRPFWPRKFAGNYEVSTTKAPSRLFMFVQVPLIPMEAVAESIDINIYLRGGKSFEVSVPTQPCFGLNWDTRFLTRSNEDYQALQGYAPYYAGTWHSFNNGNSLIFRWGTLSDEIAQFPSIKVDPGDFAYVQLQGDYPTGTQKWVYFVVWPSGHGYNIGIPVRNIKDAQGLGAHLYRGGSLTDAAAIKYFVPATEQGSGSYSKGNPIGRILVQAIPDINGVPQGEDERNTVVLDTTSTLATTSHGFTFFGENFNDLKTLMRRYQLYGQYIMSNTTDKDIDHCTFTFPCLPQGLALDVGTSSRINETFNRCRDGIIPIISSGYRYYRGGLRFKIIFPTSEPINMWVQHRPDRRLGSWDDAKIIACSSVKTGQGVFNHGYASQIQVGRVNSVLEFEIPFYNATCYNLLQKFKKVAACDTYATSLGQVAIGFQATAEVLNKMVGKPIFIYYSLADDMQYSSWVGFQPMIILDRLPVPAKPEGPLEYVKSAINSHFSKVADEVVTEQSAKIKEGVAASVSDVIDAINEAAPHVSNQAKQSIFGVVSHLMHVCINQSAATISWALVSVFMHLGIFTLDFIAKASEVCTRLLNALGIGAKEPQMSADSGVTAHPEAEDEIREACGAWVSVIYTALCSAFQTVANKPKAMKDWARLITIDLGNNVRTSNQIYVFVKNSFDVLRQIFLYVVGSCHPDAKLLTLLEDEPEIVKRWVKECLYLTDPQFGMRRADDQSYIERVFEAQSFGQILITQMTDETSSSKHMATITRIFDKITKMKTDLTEMGANPFIRKECFTICMTGAPGIGKSFLTDKLCLRLLRANNTPITNGLKCIISPLSQYWDQCDHQPVLCVDDMWAVETGTMLENQLAMLFQVHSPIVLSPPKADLDGKKMRYNPEIFIYNTNKPFPVFDRTDMGAVYRRRHVLIDCRASQTKIDGCPHCTGEESLATCDPKWLRDCHHIEFRYAQDVMCPDNWSSWMAYEPFMEWLTAIYLKNRVRTHQLFEERVLELESGRNRAPLEGASILEEYEEVRRERLIQYAAYKQRSMIGDLNNMCVSLGKEFSEKSLNLIPGFSLPRFMSATPESDDPLSEPVASYSSDEVIDCTDTPNGFESVILDEWAANEVVSEKLYDRILDWCNSHDEHDLVFDDVLVDVGAAIACLHNKLETRAECKDEVRLFRFIQTCCQRFRHTSESCRCIHWLTPMDQIYVENGIMKTVNVGQFINRPLREIVDLSEICGETCLHQSKFWRYAYYKTWLYSNPTHRARYNAGKRTTLPPYFQEGVCDVQIDGWFKRILVWLHAKVDSILSPTMRYLREFFVKHSRICLFVFMFIASSLPAVVGSVRMIRDNQRLNQALIDKAKEGNLNYSVKGWSQPEGLKYGEHVTPKARLSPRNVPSAKPQDDTQQVDVALKRIRANMCYIECHRPDGYTKRYRALLLKNRMMLFLRHYHENIMKQPEGTLVIFTYAFNSEERIKCVRGIELRYQDLEKTEYGRQDQYDSNFMIVKLPASIPEAKDLTKFISPIDEHRRTLSDGILVNEKNTELVHFSPQNRPHIIAEGDLRDVIMETSYTYNYHGRGVCGSVLLSRNLQKPIIGMHVAGVEGVNGYGISEPLFYETFVSVPKSIDTPYEDVQETILEPVDLALIDLDTCLYPQGTVPPKLCQPQSEKTSIKPSLIHGVFPVETEPNPLSKRDARIAPNDPLKLGVEKYGFPTKDFPRDLLERATQHLKEKFITVIKPINGCKIRSLQDAICGVPGVEGYDSISWETSCGFPLTSIKPKNEKGKRWLFKMEETQNGYKLLSMRQELKSMIETHMEMRRRGIKPQTLFSDCLKDTCLPVEKCKIPGKTRVFSIAPIQYTIPFRQYFLDFMASYRRARFSAEHGIGINVNSTEWTQLAMDLSKKGDKILTGDYSNYGPSLNMEVVIKAFEIIIDWILHYTEEENIDELQRVLWCFAQEIACSWHIAKNLVFRIPGGIPSGSPITDILNSIVGCLYQRMAWLELTNRPLSDFTKHVELRVYGDDVIANVSDEVIDEFNTETLFQFFAKYGIKFTDTDKTGTIVKYRTLKDATFLKHGFLPHPTRPGLILANLDKRSVQGAANWVHSKELPLEEATIINAKQCLELAYGWGPQYFGVVRQKLIDAFRVKNIYIDLITWDEMDNRCFGDS